MSLLTELSVTLLTESGLPLLAENETDGGTGDPGGGTGDPGGGTGDPGGGTGGGPIMLKAKAALQLFIHAALNSIKVFTPLPMKAKAPIRLISTGILKARKGIRVKAALRVIARQGTAQPPSGIGMQMKIITDPYRQDVILDQYLLVWCNGHPNQCRVALQIDDAIEFQPAFIWQNPGVTAPAILKIDSAAIAGDGKSHLLKVSAWQAVGNRTSARSTISEYAKTPIVRPATQPEWCGATSIRQGETIYLPPYNWVYGNVPDLTRIDWRHTGAVQIMARIPVRNPKTGKVTLSNIVVGYADHDETRFYVENIGLQFNWSGGILHDVLFGVAAIQNGTFGPVTWANAPVNIRDVHPNPQEAITSPDEIAGTARVLRLDWCKDEIGKALFAENGWTYPVYLYPETADTKRRNIIDTAIDKALRRIKDATRQGGSVTLDDLGRFEARWNEARTIRSVAFVASPGFIASTRAGIVLTDAQAKALNP
jgi:hypothetical protein